MTAPEKQTLTLNFRPDGVIRTLYDEAVDLSSLGEIEIRRGSHVEPILGGPNNGMWQADLSPVGGPVLGPFAKRSAALQAEHRWLDDNWVRPKPEKEP